MSVLGEGRQSVETRGEREQKRERGADPLVYPVAAGAVQLTVDWVSADKRPALTAQASAPVAARLAGAQQHRRCWARAPARLGWPAPALPVTVRAPSCGAPSSAAQ